MDISELRRPYGGRHPVVGGQAVERFVVVFTGDPDHLAIREAGGSREDHGSGAVCLRILQHGGGHPSSAPGRSEANCPVRVRQAVDPGAPGAVAAHAEQVVALALLNHNHGVACHLICQAVFRLAADRGEDHGHRIGCG